MTDGITIEVTDITTGRELHALLRQHLEFPDFYGMNWDAFWDSITGLVEIPEHIAFVGWAELTARLPRDAALLRTCLDDYRQQYQPAFVADYA